MNSADKPHSGKARKPEPPRQDEAMRIEAMRIIEAYIADLREILKKLRRRLD